VALRGEALQVPARVSEPKRVRRAVRAGFRREQARHPVRPSAAAARMAREQRVARKVRVARQPAAARSARALVAQPKAVPREASDAAAVP
jgi:hypothetical protein